MRNFTVPRRFGAFLIFSFCNAAFFSLLRVVFYFANKPAEILGSAPVAKAFFIGSRFDLREAFIFALPLGIIFLFPYKKWLKKFTLWLYTLAFAAIMLIYFVDFGYYAYLTNKDNWQEVDDDDTKNTDVDLSPKDVSDVQDYVDKDLASDNFRDTKEAQLADLMTRYGKIKYSDQDISGVIYAWGNINANIGKNSTLNLTGAMVAYGGNPKEKTPGKNNKGEININAGTIGMTLDPDYMGVFLAANAKRKVKQVMFSNF